MDSDENDFVEGEIDEQKHDKLVEEVLNLNKVQNLKKASRSEPALHISEFNLVNSILGKKGSVHINELTSVLKTRKHVDITRKVKTTSKLKTLPKPLEKPQADRIKRSLNYEKARLNLDKWEGVVTANRASANLAFPLNSHTSLKLKEKNAQDYIKTWRLKTEIEEELEKALPQTVEEYHIDPEQKEKEHFELTASELLERRKEMAKLRAHQSYKESKARRQNKIKSKKYHRIMKREKIKQQLKEFEELQKTNPEEALKRLEEIEKARAEERFSLRHKGTGQWARNKQIRAKYDKESRQVLAQQLSISRDLTSKLKSSISDSEDEGVDVADSPSLGTKDEGNPWISSAVKPGKDVLDFVSGYRKYWNEANQITASVDETVDDPVSVETKNVVEKPQKAKKSPKLKSKKVSVKKIANTSTTEWEVDEIFDKLESDLQKKAKSKVKTLNKKEKAKDVKTKKKTTTKTKKLDLSLPSQARKVPIIDEQLIEAPHKSVTSDESTPINNNLQLLDDILKPVELPPQKANDIDPEKYVKPQKATNLKTAVPDLTATDENEEPDEQRNLIIEAFEDDDVLEDFRQEKQDEIDKDKPKDVDLYLPGWGAWGGANIKPNNRKRKRFTIKTPKELPRRDDNKGSLIINESAQKKIRAHQVNEVPFPFKSVKDFEASIRAPIGNTFVPETAFKRNIRPTLTTKRGAIIEPMSKDVLISKKMK